MSKLIGSFLILAFAGWAGSVSAGPITGADVVTVNGTGWAQVDLFTNLSWNDINAVCPNGVCGAGTLNSHDMEGWLWASVDGVNALFNTYLSAGGVSGSQLLGPGADFYLMTDSTWAPAFFADGWRSTQQSTASIQTLGLVSGEYSPTVGRYPGLIDTQPGYDDIANTSYVIGNAFKDASFGGWFYWAGEQPPSGVPATATHWLLGLGLAVLGMGRRKRKLQR